MIEGTEGGESPVTFNSDIVNDLNSKNVDSIAKRKKRYMRNTSDEKYGDYITCQSTFETKSREVGLFELNCSKKPAFRGVSRTPTVI